MTKCCGRERRGSMANFTHQEDGCGSICAPGTEKTTIVPISVLNLEADETREVEVEFDPNCLNSSIAATVSLNVTIDLQG